MMDLGAHALAPSDLPDRFRRFADTEAAGVSPLYTALARAAAENPTALAIAALRDPAQPPANLLLAAVHHLIRRGDPHPLRAYFPSVVDAARDPADAGPAFDDFVATRREVLAALVRGGRVATNEPARAAALMLALSVGVDMAGGADRLALVDAGCSAGLTLYPDLMAIDFGSGRVVGPPASPLTVRVRLDPPDAFGPIDLPPVVERVGVDLRPLRADDPDDADWLRALIWPEQADRFATLEAALALARVTPPRLVAGDASALIGELVAAAPPEALACVTHCMTLHQWTEPARRLFHEQLKAASLRRTILRASLEHRPGDGFPTVDVSVYAAGAQDARVTLAAADPHGRWIALHA